MTEVTPHPLKTQGFHHFFILLFYDHPANDVTIMKEGHPEAGTPLFWWVRLELNQRCFRCHGFTDRCDRQLRALTHMVESAELESDTVRCDPLSQMPATNEYSARDCAPQPLKLSIHSGGIEHPCRR